MTYISGLPPLSPHISLPSLVLKPTCVGDSIEFGVQERGPSFSFLYRLWNGLKWPFHFLFRWTFGWFYRSAKQRESLFQKIPEEDKTTFYLTGEANGEVKLGKNRTLFLGTSLPKEKLIKILPSIIKEENIHEIVTDNLKKAKLLWECGLETKSQINFDPQKRDPFNRELLNLLQEAFSQKRALQGKKKEALKRIEYEIVSGVLDPYSETSTLKQQKGQLKKLEALFKTQFDLKALEEFADQEHAPHFKTNLQELLKYSGVTASVSIEPFSLSVSSVLTLLEDKSIRIMIIPQTCIFKARR